MPPPTRRPPPCPVCVHVLGATSRHLAWLFADGLADPDVLRRLRAGGGYCHHHARHLLARQDGYDLARAYEDVLRALPVVGSTAATTRRTPARGGGTGRGRGPSDCPACAAATAALDDVVARVVGPPSERPSAVAVDRGRPLCLHHLDVTLRRAPWSRLPAVQDRLTVTLDHLARRAAATAGPDDWAGVIALVAGLDPDQPVREPVRPAAGVDGDPTVVGAGAGIDAGAGDWAGGRLDLDGLRGELGAGRCPCCTAGTAAGRRWLTWFGEAIRSEPSTVDDVAGLCRGHLHDLVAVAPDAVGPVAGRAIERWQQRAAALPASGEVPDASLWRRVAAGGPLAPGGGLRRRVERTTRAAPCPACRAQAVAVDRSAALLAAAASDRRTLDVLAIGGSPCVRHLDVLTAGDGTAGACDPIVERTRTRVGLLVWELRELARKTDRTTRHESIGPERDAWRRALLLVVGDVAAERGVTADRAAGGRVV